MVRIIVHGSVCIVACSRGEGSPSGGDFRPQWSRQIFTVSEIGSKDGKSIRAASDGLVCATNGRPAIVSTCVQGSTCTVESPYVLRTARCL